MPIINSHLSFSQCAVLSFESLQKRGGNVYRRVLSNKFCLSNSMFYFIFFERGRLCRDDTSGTVLAVQFLSDSEAN